MISVCGSNTLTIFSWDFVIPAKIRSLVFTVTTQQNPVCPECGCKDTVKKGQRRNRLQIHQVFKCTECLHRFTGAPAKHKTYPLRLILETVSTFNLGYLRARFYSRGARQTLDGLMHYGTGEPLTARYLIEHLREARSARPEYKDLSTRQKGALLCLSPQNPAKSETQISRELRDLTTQNPRPEFWKRAPQNRQ